MGSHSQLLVLACLILVPSAGVANDAIAEIERVLELDPTLEAQKSARVDPHFLQVRLERFVTPGVGSNQRFCFSAVAPLRSIEQTDRLPVSERRGPLGFRIRAYAKSFNVAMAQELETMGLSRCPPGLDWNDAVRAVHDYLVESNLGYLVFGDVVGDPAIEIVTTSRADPTATAIEVCEILDEAGVPPDLGRVLIRSEESRVDRSCRAGGG